MKHGWMFAALLLLTGCGQTGALYLPEGDTQSPVRIRPVDESAPAGAGSTAAPAPAPSTSTSAAAPSPATTPAESAPGLESRREGKEKVTEPAAAPAPQPTN